MQLKQLILSTIEPLDKEQLRTVYKSEWFSRLDSDWVMVSACMCPACTCPLAFTHILLSRPSPALDLAAALDLKLGKR